MGRLDGKVALITGAARGTGAACARRFVAEGARVVLGDILDDRGKAVAAELGADALYTHLDITSEVDWESAVELTLRSFGRLDVLINNAAVLHMASIESTTLDDWNRTVNVNQTGAFLGIRAVIPALREAGGGSIVNVSSIDGLEGMNFVSAYAATKWALRGLTKCAALELGRDAIRVNTVCPAGGSEEMAGPWRPEGGSEEDPTGYTQKRPLPRRAEIEEIVAMILFLASDEASFCTGGDYPVDGGHSCGSLLSLPGLEA
jgi:3alpha(or 20beta)-hydroxysteroid dehydrogenase